MNRIIPGLLYAYCSQMRGISFSSVYVAAKEVKESSAHKTTACIAERSSRNDLKCVFWHTAHLQGARSRCVERRGNECNGEGNWEGEQVWRVIVICNFYVSLIVWFVRFVFCFMVCFVCVFRRCVVVDLLVHFLFRLVCFCENACIPPNYTFPIAFRARKISPAFFGVAVCATPHCTSCRRSRNVCSPQWHQHFSTWNDAHYVIRSMLQQHFFGWQSTRTKRRRERGKRQSGDLISFENWWVSVVVAYCLQWLKS